MISVDEAKQYIQQYTQTGPTVVVDLYEACGYAIAKDVFSPVDFPSFRQSAMDGYAFRLDDADGDAVFVVEREIQAGTIDEISSIKKGEAIRIFTGAKVPDDADTIVIQEHVEINGNNIRITNIELTKGSNIRPVASQTRQGDCILKKGTLITPGAAGLLASVGISIIDVVAKPRCTILNTGRELVKPGNDVQQGQIYESNSYALVAALKKLQLDVCEIMWVDDDEQQTIAAIQTALEKTDVLLITGGVSVGDYDFVESALAKNGVAKIFHKVKQKPGKPLYFGIKENSIIFGLPGNPGSVLTCFYEYVVPCLQLKMGIAKHGLLTLQLPLSHDISKKAGLTHFLKGTITSTGVAVLNHQESYKMNAFADADCLIVVDEQMTNMQQGDLVNVHILAF